MRLTAFFAAVVVGWLAVPAWAAGYQTHGVSLPNGAVEIGENRFRLPSDLEQSLKWYRSVYRPEKYPRKLIVNQPGLKAYHVSNPDPRSKWDGFNIYEYEGETRLYVLVREK